jgi:hypothetical protein
VTTKSLSNFPARNGKSFSSETYQHDVRQAVAADSPYNGEVGLELELEGTNLPGNYRAGSIGGVTWTPHEDGSLRAVGGRGAGGMEYVLSQPCAVQDVRTLCDNLFEYIRSEGGQIVNSTRCSTHVHLNMKGAKLNQICSFVGLWGCFEDVLANWCGRHRSGNHFALRLRDSEMAVENWKQAFEKGVFQFNREQRYLALNPASLNTFGSLEVRTMRGVENSDEVVTWVEALHKLRQMSRSEEFENPQTIAALLSGNSPRGFFENTFRELRIFDDLEQKTVDLGESVDELVRDGFRRVQPIIYSLPWQEVIPEIKKPFIPDPFGGSKKKVTAGRNGLGNFDWAEIAPPPLRPRRITFAAGAEVEYIGTDPTRRRRQFAIVRRDDGTRAIVIWPDGLEEVINRNSFRLRREHPDQAVGPELRPPAPEEFHPGDRVIYRNGRAAAEDWIGEVGTVEAVAGLRAVVDFDNPNIVRQSVQTINIRRI